MPLKGAIDAGLSERLFKELPGCDPHVDSKTFTIDTCGPGHSGNYTDGRVSRRSGTPVISSGADLGQILFGNGSCFSCRNDAGPAVPRGGFDSRHASGR